MNALARFLIAAGIILLLLGLAVGLLGFAPGRLPGDIRWRGRHGAFYFPVVTCIAISVILSVISWLFRSR